MKLRISSILIDLATCSIMPTNEFKHERFESSCNLWGICSGNYVEVYVT